MCDPAAACCLDRPTPAPRSLVSLLPDAALTPRSLCRRILTAVRQRLHPDRELSYLEMVLTYFIDLDPSPERFARQLDEYVADARPGIADAAATLRVAW